VIAATGWALFTLAAVIAGLNFYLSFMRQPLYKWLGRESKFVSGLPLIGTVLLVLAHFFLQRSWFLWWGTVVVGIMDTGGLPWFVVTVMWMAMRRR
jgi:hypothetical protein